MRRPFAAAVILGLLVSSCQSRRAIPEMVLEWPAAEVLGEDWADIEPVNFAEEVQPILESKCLHCHQRESRMTRLVFHTRQDLLDANAERPVLIPGKPEESTLFLVTVLPEHFVEAMPPIGGGHEPLTAVERSVLYHWIMQGAAWPDGVILSDPLSRQKVASVER